jgi:hypothetical protein
MIRETPNTRKEATSEIKKIRLRDGIREFGRIGIKKLNKPGVPVARWRLKA